MKILKSSRRAAFLSWTILSVSASLMTLGHSIAQESPEDTDSGPTLLLGNPLIGNITPANPDDSSSDDGATASETSEESPIVSSDAAGAEADRNSADVQRQLMTQLLEAYDQRVFSIEGVVEILGGEQKKIVEFVQNEIAYQPYEGSLKGPLATLIARSGNSLDQALLLQNMLALADVNTTIMAKKLASDEMALIASVYPAASRSVPDYALPADSLANLVENTSFGDYVSSEEIEQIRESRQNGLSGIIEVVDNWKPAFLSNEAVSTLSKEALNKGLVLPSHLFWLAIDENPDVNINPVPEVGISLTGRQVGFDWKSVPQAAQHIVDINVTAEFSDQTSVALLNWQAPSSDLYLKPISIRVLPDSDTEYDNPLNESETFVLILEGPDKSAASQATYFNNSGDVYEESVAVADSIADATTSGLGGIGTALGGIFDESPAAEPVTDDKSIVDIVVQYGLTTPGVENVQHTRSMIHDAPNFDDDTPSTPMSKMVWALDVYVDSGFVPMQYVALGQIQKYLELGDIDPENFQESDGARLSSLRNSSFYANSMVFASATHAAELELVQRGGVRVYRSAPNIIALESRPRAPQDGVAKPAYEVVDIVNLAGRLVPVKQAEAAGPASSSLDLGLLWTASERNYLLRRIDPFELLEEGEGLARLANAGNDLDLALSSDPNPLMLLDNAAEVEDFLSQQQDFPARGADKLIDMVSNGYWALITEDSLHKTSREWWRLDPDSGGVLGVNESGRGDTAETGVNIATTTETIPAWKSYLEGLDALYRVAGCGAMAVSLALKYDSKPVNAASSAYCVAVGYASWVGGVWGTAASVAVGGVGLGMAGIL